MTLNYSFCKNCFGSFLIVHQGVKVYALEFFEKDDSNIQLEKPYDLLNEIQSRLKNCFSTSLVLVEQKAPIHTEFQDKEGYIHFTTHYEAELIGTPFQKEVWNELIKIPTTEVKYYSELSIQIGSPSATRAVARAVAQNKIALLVPCHRILPKIGGIGKFRWGSELKSRILELEGFQF